jgi:hypothetical protein
MDRDTIALTLLAELNSYLLKTENTCLVKLDNQTLSDYMSQINEKANVIMSVVGGEQGGGQGGGNGGGSLIGTITNVVFGDGGNGPVFNALILGEITEPASTLPTGVGVVQPYQGGVVLTNDPSADVFVAPLVNINQMSPTGSMGRVFVSGPSISVLPVTTDVEIQPGEAVILVPIHP